MSAPPAFRISCLALLACFGSGAPAQSDTSRSAAGQAGEELGALAAEHTAKPAKGISGLTEVPLSVTNEGTEPLSCEVTFAHWYSMSLGSAAYGVTLTTRLWSDTRSGAVFVINPVGDQVAIERVWCGRSGQSWATRFEMPLLRKAGASEKPMRYACASAAASGDGAAPPPIACRPL